ncbi:hypothetical protein NDU88_008019 [Pleurodeles waltl]|uniref:Endonuclease-reverse transcriptase n=1 Tax=Pleurodeles waltl TaxID=8319 RepID=A0AAV7NWI5_PLEWA|nr:hypothetical protein NDU88_008019 [Pleurodeles waltl]
MWNRRGIILSTKLKMYKAVVLPTLLYACETWTVHECHAKKLNGFHMYCLRRLLKITWQDNIRDTNVLSQAGLPSIYTLLRIAQDRWTGHLVRMPDIRLPKKLFYGVLAEGKCTQGGQKKHFKDTLKVSLKRFGINLDSWENLAQDHPAWQSCISKGATSYEQSRTAQAQKKRELRKSIDNSLPTKPADHLCPTCRRVRIGLICHRLNVMFLVIVDIDRRTTHVCQSKGVTCGYCVFSCDGYCVSCPNLNTCLVTV